MLTHMNCNLASNSFGFVIWPEQLGQSTTSDAICSGGARGGPNPKSRQKFSKKNAIKLVGYTFRLKNYVGAAAGDMGYMG